MTYDFSIFNLIQLFFLCNALCSPILILKKIIYKTLKLNLIDYFGIALGTYNRMISIY
jgi:hypothetical protein